MPGVFGEEEKHPRNGILFELLESPHPLHRGEFVHRLVALQGTVVFTPFVPGTHVIYFTHFSRSCMYESK